MPIFDLVFDIGEILHRQCDLLSAWDAGLMTTGEAKMLGGLFFNEDDGATLIQIYQDLFDEELELEGTGGRVPAELSVALARIATNIDAVLRLGDKQRRMMGRIDASKGAFEPRVEDWEEVYGELTELCIRPSICMATLDDRKRFLLVKTELIRRIGPIATFAGYDKDVVEAAIDTLVRNARGEV